MTEYGQVLPPFAYRAATVMERYRYSGDIKTLEATPRDRRSLLATEMPLSPRHPSSGTWIALVVESSQFDRDAAFLKKA